jgi:hypothetical protein
MFWLAAVPPGLYLLLTVFPGYVLLTEWPRSDAHSDRDRIDRARQDAENLFKPRPRAPAAEVVDAAANGVADQRHAKRQPRIFMVPAVVPMDRAKAVNSPEVKPAAKPIPRRKAAKRETRHIPPSQFGRVRALAHYGMTQAQVAELYGVGVGEIERIIGRPDA